MSRTAGMTGKLPASKRDRLVLDDHVDLAALAATVPPDWNISVPAVVDQFENISWPMYGNDRLGDCGEAGAGHALQAATNGAVTPSDSDIIALYETQGYVPGDPSTDRGTDLHNLLQWWTENEWCGVKLEGYAQLRSFNASHMRAALYYFKSVYCGVQLPYAAVEQFDMGEDWTIPPPWSSFRPGIDGGHCIVLERVLDGLDELGWVTWAAWQRSSLRWWRTYSDEAWVLLFPSVLDGLPASMRDTLMHYFSEIA